MTQPGSRPPRFAERLLTRALSGTPYRDDILGDLRESHDALALRQSPRYARWWYRLQTLQLAARYAIRLRPARPRWRSPMDRVAMECRYAARSLAKEPLMSATIVATLALAIGANAAVFGVVDALVLHPIRRRSRRVTCRRAAPRCSIQSWRPEASRTGVE